MTGTIDVILRIRKAISATEIERTFLSIIVQTYRPLRVLIVNSCQSAAEFAIARTALERVRHLAPEIVLQVVNSAAESPAVWRALTSTAPLPQPAGRFLAYVGAGDLLFPRTCERAIGRLLATGAAVFVGGVQLRHVCQIGAIRWTASQWPARAVSSLAELAANPRQLPAGCLIDCERLPRGFLASVPLVHNGCVDAFLRRLGPYCGIDFAGPEPPSGVQQVITEGLGPAMEEEEILAAVARTEGEGESG